MKKVGSKFPYTPTEIELLNFVSADIITSSGAWSNGSLGNDDENSDPGGWTQTPQASMKFAIAIDMCLMALEMSCPAREMRVAHRANFISSLTEGRAFQEDTVFISSFAGQSISFLVL